MITLKTLDQKYYQSDPDCVSIIIDIKQDTIISLTSYKSNIHSLSIHDIDKETLVYLRNQLTKAIRKFPHSYYPDS